MRSSSPSGSCLLQRAEIMREIISAFAGGCLKATLPRQLSGTHLVMLPSFARNAIESHGLSCRGLDRPMLHTHHLLQQGSFKSDVI